MQQQEYLEQRLDDQMNWFDKKSQFNQKRYKQIKSTEIILAALIPLMAGYIDNLPILVYFIGAFGALITILEAMNTLNNYQENWLKFRTMAESLKKERFLFLTQSIPYDGPNAFAELVLKVEALLTEENSQWVEAMRKQQQELSNQQHQQTQIGQSNNP